MHFTRTKALWIANPNLVKAVSIANKEKIIGRKSYMFRLIWKAPSYVAFIDRFILFLWRPFSRSDWLKNRVSKCSSTYSLLDPSALKICCPSDVMPFFQPKQYRFYILEFLGGVFARTSHARRVSVYFPNYPNTLNPCLASWRIVRSRSLRLSAYQMKNLKSDAVPVHAEKEHAYGSRENTS